MVNYDNGKIYKIESHLGDKIYIGSTTKKYLSARMANHRYYYTRWNAGIPNTWLTAFTLFEEYGVDNCKMTLLEAFSCDSKDKLTARESHYIRTLECVNKIIPDRNLKEWKDTNRDILIEKHRLYRKANQELIREKNRLYCKANQELIREKNRIYREANKEKNTTHFYTK